LLPISPALYNKSKIRATLKTIINAARGLALAAFFLISLAACDNQNGDSPLRIGCDLSYPPFETIGTSGQPEGVSVDLAQAIGGKLSRPVVIENIPFVGLIPALQSGRIDMVISSMTDTEERRKSITFSDPYLTVGLALLVNKQSGLMGLEELDQAGRTLVVRQGTTGEVWARSTLKQGKILAVERESSAVMEVVQGNADAFVYDQMSVWENARRHPDSTVAILSPVREERWAIGLKKDNDELVVQVNNALRELKAEGFFNQLGEKFLARQKADFEAQGVPFVF
jgi:polar amino acid transport system substrate-binding protein